MHQKYAGDLISDKQSKDRKISKHNMKETGENQFN